MVEDPKIREPQPEALDLNKYSALYGRFLLASQPSADVPTIMNPDPAKPLTVDATSAIISPDRDHNRYAEQPSVKERLDAWRKVDFNDAYAQWESRFKQAINGINGEARFKAFQAVLPDIQPAEFTVDNAEALYNDFCGARSNIDKFAKTVTKNLIQQDGKIDSEHLTAILPELKWISTMLFGKQAGTVVSRIIALEAEIINNPDNIIATVFDTARINTLTKEEKDILAYLHGGVSAETVARHTAEPQPAATPKVELSGIDEEIQFLRDRIEAVKRDETPPFISMGGPEAAQRYLEGQLALVEARKQKSAAKPAVPEPTATPEGQSTEAKTENVEKAREELAAMRPPADDAPEEDKITFGIKRGELLRRAKIKFGRGKWVTEEAAFQINITKLWPRGSDGKWYFAADTFNEQTGVWEKTNTSIPIDQVIYTEEPPVVKPEEPAATPQTAATEPPAAEPELATPIAPVQPTEPEAEAQPVVLEPIAASEPTAGPKPTTPKIEVPMTRGVRPPGSDMTNWGWLNLKRDFGIPTPVSTPGAGEQNLPAEAETEPATESQLAKPQNETSIAIGTKIQNGDMTYTVLKLPPSEDGQAVLRNTNADGYSEEMTLETLKEYLADTESGWEIIPDELPAGTFASGDAPTPSGTAEEQPSSMTELETTIPTPDTTDAIELKGQDLGEELNANLLNQTGSEATFSVPAKTLTRYLASFAGDNNIKNEGEIAFRRDGKEIKITGLIIDEGILARNTKITLLITNAAGRRIRGQISVFNASIVGKQKISRQVHDLDFAFRKKIDELIAAQNPAWKTDNVTIAGRKITLGFHKKMGPD